MTTIKDRVLQIAKYYGVSYEKFSSDIGMSYASFKGKAKLTPLNSDAVVSILTIYPDVDCEWLLTGNGSMLKTGETKCENSEPQLWEMIGFLKNQIETQNRIIEELTKKVGNDAPRRVARAGE